MRKARVHSSQLLPKKRLQAVYLLLHLLQGLALAVEHLARRSDVVGLLGDFRHDDRQLLIGALELELHGGEEVWGTLDAGDGYRSEGQDKPEAVRSAVAPLGTEAPPPVACTAVGGPVEAESIETSDIGGECGAKMDAFAAMHSHFKPSTNLRERSPR